MFTVIAMFFCIVCDLGWCSLLQVLYKQKQKLLVWKTRWLLVSTGYSKPNMVLPLSHILWYWTLSLYYYSCLGRAQFSDTIEGAVAADFWMFIFIF